jgi:hypothetical protein
MNLGSSTSRQCCGAAGARPSWESRVPHGQSRVSRSCRWLPSPRSLGEAWSNVHRAVQSVVPAHGGRRRARAADRGRHGALYLLHDHRPADVACAAQESDPLRAGGLRSPTRCLRGQGPGMVSDSVRERARRAGRDRYRSRSPNSEPSAGTSGSCVAQAGDCGGAKAKKRLEASIASSQKTSMAVGWWR